MTRVNAGIFPGELNTKLIIAENHEIMRIPNAIAKGKAVLDGDYPSSFCLGKGHVKFFYPRLMYIYRRWSAIYGECVRRGFQVSDWHDIFHGLKESHPELWGDWTPRQSDRQLLLDRIRERNLKLNPIPMSIIKGAKL